MPHYAASYVPLVSETQVLRWDPNSQRKPSAIKVENAFELLSGLRAGDHLWIMMGSTNTAVALAAFRNKGVEVHQLSFSRFQTWFTANGKEPEQEDAEAEEQGSNGRKTKVKPSQVLQVAQEAPELFYPMTVEQSEVLEIVAAWKRVSDAMEARKAAANRLRARIWQDAFLYGKARERDVSTDEEVEALLADLLNTKDEQRRKRVPGDPHIAFLTEQEERERSRLANLCHGSNFYLHLFGDVESVGSMIGARVIAAIERIERFARAEDLSNYAGMLPRGPEGRLPSRKRSKGKQLARSPMLNTTSRLFQDQIFQWGRNTPLGQMLIQQVERECPCTQEARKANKDLARQYVEVVKRARVATTRYFLEQIVWPKWRAYIGVTS